MVTVCGICGFSLSPTDNFNSRRILREMLLAIDNRGGDATGYAYPKNGNILIKKAPLDAKEFVDWVDVPYRAQTVLGHTRFATQGSEKRNVNNHPIRSGNIVGIHNGCIWNDSRLFELMDVKDRRNGLVDSEAIFASLAYGQELGEDGKPRLSSTMLGCLEQVIGTAAIAWLNEEDTSLLHLARLASSPLVVGQTEKGSLFFSSTEYALKSSLEKCGIELVYTEILREGEYWRVRDGRVEEVALFNADDWGYGEYAYGGKTTYISGCDAGVTKTTTAVAVKEQGWDTDSSTDVDGESKPDEDNSDIAALASWMLDDTPFDKIEGDAHYQWFEDREKAIDNYMGQIAGAESAIDVVRCLHGFLRVGDWVRTNLQEEELVGQIVSMPQVFPWGQYVIRLYAENKRYESGYEPMLVARKHNEFRLEI